MPWFSENNANISKKVAEIEDGLPIKVNKEIAIHKSFKNPYTLEKANANNMTLASIGLYRRQVESSYVERDLRT